MRTDVALEIGYWIAAGCLLYTFMVYPAILLLMTRLRPRPIARSGFFETKPSVSVLIVVRDEESAVARRVAEFIETITRDGLDGEIVIVSDGSTDGTVSALRRFQGGAVPVSVVEFAENVGKAAALSAGVATAVNEVVAFADARQSWHPDALSCLLDDFADPAVGAVSGELFVESAPGVMAGVGLYWRYEKALRRMESLVHSTVGVTGAIAAVRRSLFRPIPAGTLLDDVYWPLRVAMQGYRVIFESRAHAFDRLPDEVGAEFRRKVRTLSGNYQLIARLPEALLPWRNPVWFALVSHKLMRLVIPWAYGLAAVFAVARGGPFYLALFVLQIILTCLCLAGLIPAVAIRSKVAAAGGSFLILNAAVWLAFWVWVTGRSSRSWSRTHYRAAEALVSHSVEGSGR